MLNATPKGGDSSMEDVKTNETVQNAEQAPAEETAAQEPQPEEQTTVEPQMEEVAPEKTVPYSRFKEVNSKFKEMQRRLAEVEGSQKLNQYDPNDTEQVLQHPLVQEMMIKQAKSELTDYARTTLDQYPNLHPAVKKAILGNVRGFVNESTTDVETAKLDLQDYIEGIAEEAEAQVSTPPKNVQVASTNVPKSDAPGAKPADVQRILDKPMTDWTAEEEKIVADYSAANPK